MNCSACGEKVSPGCKFCPSCGTALVATANRAGRPDCVRTFGTLLILLLFGGAAIAVIATAVLHGDSANKKTGSPWKTFVTTDAMTDARTVKIDQKRTSSLSQEAVFDVQCSSDPTVMLGTPYDKGMGKDALLDGVVPVQTVGIRFGKRPAEYEQWVVNRIDQGIVAPHWRKVLTSLATSDSVTIEYRSQGFTQAATFQTGDLRKILYRYPECAALLSAWPSPRNSPNSVQKKGNSK